MHYDELQNLPGLQAVQAAPSEYVANDSVQQIGAWRAWLVGNPFHTMRGTYGSFFIFQDLYAIGVKSLDMHID